MQQYPKLPSIQAMLKGTLFNVIIDEQPKINHRRHMSTSSSVHRRIEAPQPLEPEPSMDCMIPHALLQPIPHRRHLHARSFSDHTHPYPPPTLHVKGPQISATHHRRAISTSTLDLLLQHNDTPSPCSKEEVGYVSDDPVVSNRYPCTFCQKKFSRPSSLRIHTYSHTGERPFACPEKGCSRKFSVQSNMRRHLKVHRLEKPLKKSTLDRSRFIHKPLAAKPV